MAAPPTWHGRGPFEGFITVICFSFLFVSFVFLMLINSQVIVTYEINTRSNDTFNHLFSSFARPNNIYNPPVNIVKWIYNFYYHFHVHSNRLLEWLTQILQILITFALLKGIFPMDLFLLDMTFTADFVLSFHSQSIHLLIYVFVRLSPLLKVGRSLMLKEIELYCFYKNL